LATRSISYIAVDLDGCIRGEGRNLLPKEHYLAQHMLARYIEQANLGNVPHLGGCTGRDVISAETAFLGLVLPNSWTLFEGGARAINFATGQALVNPCITPEKKWALKEVREKLLPSAVLNPRLSLYKGKKDYVVTFEWAQDIHPEDQESEYRDFSDALRNLGLKDILSLSVSSIALDVGVVDKGEGIVWIAEMMEIDPSEIVGIGDSGGDVPFLRKVGHPAAVANATDECRNVAEFVAIGSYATGVWEIIRHYLSEADISISFLEPAVS